MKIILTLSFVLLLAGCGVGTKPEIATRSADCRVMSFTTQGVVCLSEQAIWLRECVEEIARSQNTKESWFNGMGANDAVFIPKTDFAEEIFQKCISVKPLSNDDVPVYKKWLDDRILEIQAIVPGMTREQVDHILDHNGGLSGPDAAIYSHIECPVLKVRIEFKPGSIEYKGHESWQADKVKSVSATYLGFFING